jgi:hypothetical protein
LRRDIVHRQRRSGTRRGQLPAVGDHGWRHVVSEERGLGITLPEITQKQARATAQIDDHRSWRERWGDLGSKRGPEVRSEPLIMV